MTCQSHFLIFDQLLTDNVRACYMTGYLKQKLETQEKMADWSLGCKYWTQRGFIGYRITIQIML